MKRISPERKLARRKARLPKPLSLPPEWRLRRRGGVVVLEALPLAQIPWLVHGFSTRVGGASLQDGRRVLNLGYVEWDDHHRVHENRRRFVRALGAEAMAFAGLRQFHSSMVRIFGGAQPGRLKSEGPGLHRAKYKGDALVTHARGLLLTVQTADCVPILLVDPRKRVVAAIHAGWRGTAARVAQKTVGDLRMHFGTRPEDVVAAIGPAIGRCCYEVGPAVAHEFGSQFAQAAEWFEGPFAALSTGDEPTPFLWLQFDPPGHERPRRVKLDLVAANCWQLEAAGVSPSRIFSCGVCTGCRTDWLFSYRREGLRAGRLMNAIGMRNT